MRMVLLASLLLTAAASAAETERSPRIMLNPGALLCDTPEQLLEYIDGQAMATVPGCGLSTQPMWVEIEPLESYEAHHRRFDLIVYHFPMMTASGLQWWTQYGYWGVPEHLNTAL